MRFTVDGIVYSLGFTRHVPEGPRKHVRTTAVLCRQITKDTLTDWREIDAAVVVRHSSDLDTKEAARQSALKKLAKQLRERKDPGYWSKVSGAMLSAYFNRPRQKDPAAIEQQIARLQKELSSRLAPRVQPSRSPTVH